MGKIGTLSSYCGFRGAVLYQLYPFSWQEEEGIKEADLNWRFFHWFWGRFCSCNGVELLNPDWVGSLRWFSAGDWLNNGSFEMSDWKVGSDLVFSGLVGNTRKSNSMSMMMTEMETSIFGFLATDLSFERTKCPWFKRWQVEVNLEQCTEYVRFRSLRILRSL